MLNFDAAAGKFTTTGGHYTATGTTTYTVTGTDKNSETISDTFTVTVTANSPPVTPGFVNQLFTQGTGGVYTAPAFTDADSDTITYTEGTTVCTTAGITFTAAGPANSATWTVGAGVAAGTYTCTIQADDGYTGGSVTDTFVIEVDTAPVWTPLADQTTKECDAGLNYPVVSLCTDADAGDTLTLSAVTTGQGAITASWLNFNAATGLFSGTPLDGNAGTVSIDVKCEDNHGLSATDTFTITVAANNAPTYTAIADQLVNVGDTINIVATGAWTDSDSANFACTSTLADGTALPATLISYTDTPGTSRIFGPGSTTPVGTADAY